VNSEPFDSDASIWEVYVTSLTRLINPWESWREGVVEPEKVTECILKGLLEETPYSEEINATLEYHARRIAYLAVNHTEDPIEIDVGIPALGAWPRNGEFDLLDGHHRLAAALHQDLTKIKVTFEGQESRFLEIFPEAKQVFND
jgi:hypothetical protein